MISPSPALTHVARACRVSARVSFVWRYALLCAATLCIAPALAQTDNANTHPHRRIGDVLSFALPAGVAAAAWWYDRQSPPSAEERGELSQFALSLTATLAATEVLKRSVRSERPDGSDNLSFPSGHAARAFSAATFVHRRSGFETALPLYAAATYVGWTRVDANRHRWVDVAGSLAVSATMSWWLATPRPGAGQWTASVSPRGAQLAWQLPLW